MGINVSPVGADAQPVRSFYLCERERERTERKKKKNQNKTHAKT